VNGQYFYLSAPKIICGGNPELQIVISFNEPENAQIYYKNRWQIESAFNPSPIPSLRGRSNRISTMLIQK
jgi:hypothetical protein